MIVRTKNLLTIFASIAGVALTGIAQAQTTTYTPNPADLNDLDHHKLYTWRVNNIDLTNKEIVSAKLSFDNIRNWNSEANVLHLHLFDTSVYNNVKGFYDDNPNNDNVTDLTDDFNNTRYHHGIDASGAAAPWLIANGTASSFLTDKSFTSTATDWSYDFLANNKATVLTDYLLNGKNIALGFDGDCHYYNDGVTLTIETKSATTSGGKWASHPIPEAGTLTLIALGSLGLIGGFSVRRRK